MVCKDLGSEIVELDDVIDDPVKMWAVRHHKENEDADDSDKLITQLNNEDLVKGEKVEHNSINTARLDIF